MGMTRTQRRGAAATVVAVVTAVAGLVALPGFASGAPSAASSLTGTWVASGATSGVVKVVIRRSAGGAITVDSYNACGRPRPCASGKVAATVFGPAADSVTGTWFASNQALAGASQVLLGRLVSTSRGRRLTIEAYTVFRDGSRSNTAQTRQFRRTGRASATTRNGTAATTYPAGKQPSVPDAMVGVWHNVLKAPKALVRIEITRANDGSLLVHPFGACTPTPCDTGVTAAIAYGASPSATSATRFLAPADYGFKRTLYAGLSISSKGVLTVATSSEFTDGSGRSSYALLERFTR